MEVNGSVVKALKVPGANYPPCHSIGFALYSTEFKSFAVLCKYQTSSPPTSWDMCILLFHVLFAPFVCFLVSLISTEMLNQLALK